MDVIVMTKDKDIQQHLKEYENYAIKLKRDITNADNKIERDWFETRLKAVERCIFAISK